MASRLASATVSVSFRAAFSLSAASARRRAASKASCFSPDSRCSVAMVACACASAFSAVAARCVASCTDASSAARLACSSCIWRSKSSCESKGGRAQYGAERRLGCSRGTPGWTCARPGAPSPGSAQSWSPACRAWSPRWLAVSSAVGRRVGSRRGQAWTEHWHKGRQGAQQRRRWARTPLNTVFTSSALRPAQRPCRSWGGWSQAAAVNKTPIQGQGTRGRASLGADGSCPLLPGSQRTLDTVASSERTEKTSSSRSADPAVVINSSSTSASVCSGACSAGVTPRSQVRSGETPQTAPRDAPRRLRSEPSSYSRSCPCCSGQLGSQQCEPRCSPL